MLEGLRRILPLGLEQLEFGFEVLNLLFELLGLRFGGLCVVSGSALVELPRLEELELLFELVDRMTNLVSSLLIGGRAGRLLGVGTRLGIDGLEGFVLELLPFGDGSTELLDLLDLDLRAATAAAQNGDFLAEALLEYGEIFGLVEGLLALRIGETLASLQEPFFDFVRRIEDGILLNFGCSGPGRRTEFVREAGDDVGEFVGNIGVEILILHELGEHQYFHKLILMPRKTKAKQRLDKYYNLAKEQGYRSRAAFKLFQLNKKFNFLNGASAVVDLCAAPGGWMQVCAQVMPSGSTIIGLDLIKIKPVAGCKAYQMDITVPQCVDLLRKELPAKADVFLHDGAPNVGASWAKDAYNQNDLVLSSLRLASQFLKKGGTFVTKVFRSTDYNSLIWVFNKFFGKVEATKPLASRFVSAEIFVVCLDYLAPDFIDNRLFDAKFVFQDNEADIQAHQNQKEITSVDKILQKRTHRHRSGYADDVHQIVYQPIAFSKFLAAENPYPIFLEHSSITMSAEEQDKYLNLCPPPKDYQNLMDDIKVLGKREILQLLKWRSKIKIVLNKQKTKKDGKQVKQSTKGELELEEGASQEQAEEDWVSQPEGEEPDEEDVDKLVDKQQRLLDQQKLQSQKQDLKEQRKLKQKQTQQERKVAGRGMNMELEDDQEFMEFSKHREILKLGFEEAELVEQRKQKKKQLRFKTQEQLDKNLELIYESKQQRIEHGVEKQKERRLQKSKQKLSEDDQEISEEDLACKPIKKAKKAQIQPSDLQSKFFDRDIFEGLKEQLQSAPEQVTFENPLKSQKPTKKAGAASKETPKEAAQKKGKQAKNAFEDDSDSEEQQANTRELNKTQREVQDELDEVELGIALSQRDQRPRVPISQEPFPDEDEKVKRYELNLPMSDMEKRRKKLKKLAQKEQKKLKSQQDENNAELEIVPQKRAEDYEIDELATNLALAKKMLRKKTREQIINDSFGRERYDDHDELPKWFVEDEQKHVYKIAPITKEEFEAEKQRLYEINSRVPKKVMEAKIRKWKRSQKQLKKASKQASQILETEGINEKTKVQQIQKLYKKEKLKIEKQQERKYVVSKRGQQSGKAKNTRNTVFVDKRLKKDKRALKRTAAGGGKGKKRRHVSRRKGKKQKA